MGCDIHIIVESRIDYGNARAHWYCEGSEHRIWRDYKLFSKLANVRNYPESGIIPIAPPRGIPFDAAEETRERMCDIDYHSHSWISQEEFKTNWPWQPDLKKTNDWHMLGWYYLVAHKGMAQTRFIFAFDN